MGLFLYHDAPSAGHATLVGIVSVPGCTPCRTCPHPRDCFFARLHPMTAPGDCFCTRLHPCRSSPPPREYFCIRLPPLLNMSPSGALYRGNPSQGLPLYQATTPAEHAPLSGIDSVPSYTDCRSYPSPGLFQYQATAPVGHASSQELFLFQATP